LELDLSTEIINLDTKHSLRNIFGPNEEFLRLAESKLDIKIVNRGNILRLAGSDENVKKGKIVLGKLLADCKQGYTIGRFEFNLALEEVIEEGKPGQARLLNETRIEVPSKRRFITPRTAGQAEYIKAIDANDITFAIGPAGTGKTYLAMARGVSYFSRGDYSRMILARPAVEAGEKLGFLPGDLSEKVSPYLRPVYDALYDLMDINKIQRNIDTGQIEVAPLAFMRGRTLNDSFIILDEAQNTTSEQMMMFLTRIGFNSKVVITGDITQIDLPSKRLSGLVQVQKILKNIKGIKFCYLTQQDVVRHEIVQEIVRAYDRHRDRMEKNENSETLET
jgi:phosphate starvation-inducible protein PhoH and related proteins